MTEKEVERYLVERVKEEGGKAYKFVSPGNSGVPDRMVVFPEGCIYFVELKAPGKKSSKLQERQQLNLQNLGCDVFELDCKEKVDWFIQQSEVMRLYG